MWTLFFWSLLAKYYTRVLEMTVKLSITLNALLPLQNLVVAAFCCEMFVLSMNWYEKNKKQINPWGHSIWEILLDKNSKCNIYCKSTMQGFTLEHIIHYIDWAKAMTNWEFAGWLLSSSSKLFSIQSELEVQLRMLILLVYHLNKCSS